MTGFQIFVQTIQPYANTLTWDHWIAIAALVVNIVVAFCLLYLNRKINKLNNQLNERVKRLHKAAELVTEKQKAELMTILLPEENSQAKYLHDVDFLAASAHFRGLAFAIGDKEMLDLINQRERPTGDIMADEARIRSQAQKLHTRIADLIEQETK